MISLQLAQRLQAAGLSWTPGNGDRFGVALKEMDGESFVLSDMTIEVHDHHTGSIIGFNGTTEWALDSVQQDEAVWLPSETQLREALGGSFRRLECSAEDWYLVVVSIRGAERVFADEDAAEAYGLALLALLTRVTT